MTEPTQTTIASVKLLHYNFVSRGLKRKYAMELEQWLLCGGGLVIGNL